MATFNATARSPLRTRNETMVASQRRAMTLLVRPEGRMHERVKRAWTRTLERSKYREELRTMSRRLRQRIVLTCTNISLPLDCGLSIPPLRCYIGPEVSR